MRFSCVIFLLAVGSVAHAADRTTMSPAELLLGEWRPASESFEPSVDFPNSRAYFGETDYATNGGKRTLLHEDGKRETVAYTVVRQDKEKRILEVAIHLSDGRKRKTLFRFDSSGTKSIQRTYVTESAHVDTRHLFVGPTDQAPGTQELKVNGSGKPIMVRVAVTDQTDKNPVHAKAEVWFRGHGSWWLKPELKFGGTAKKLGKRPSGSKQELIIYPESRDGEEIKVPYAMTDAMNPEGSPRDTITVEFSDAKITVYGLPVKAATGMVEIEFKR